MHVDGKRNAAKADQGDPELFLLQRLSPLERQVPGLDLSLCHRMIGRAADTHLRLFTQRACVGLRPPINIWLFGIHAPVRWQECRHADRVR